MTEADHVIRAIACLHSQNPRPEDVQNANSFLIEFIKQPRSWEVAVNLLSHKEIEVKYEACVILLEKIKNDTAQLNISQRNELKAALLERLYSLSQDPNIPTRITQKLATSIVTIAVYTKGATKDLIFRILDMARQDKYMKYCRSNLDLLLVLPEILRNARHSFQEQDDINKQMMEVLGLLKFYMSQAEVNPSHMWTLAPALECLTSLLEHEHYSLAEVHSSGVLDIVLNLLDKPKFLQKSSEAAIAGLVSGKMAESELAHDHAVELVANAVAKLLPVFKSTHDEVVAFQIGLVSSTLCSCETKWISQGSPSALKIVDLQLLCVAHPSKRICENALDFFDLLTEWNMFERQSHFGPKLYSQLTEVLVATQIPYKDDFKGWQPHDVEQDEFFKFREMVRGALDPAFTVLEHHYLEILSDILSKSEGKWQIVESVLWAFHVVEAPLMDRADSPEVQCAMNKFLVPIFTELFSDRHQNPVVLSTGASLVGGCARWFRHAPELLTQAVIFLFRCSQVAGAGNQASVAFRDVCDAASVVMSRDPTTVGNVIEHCQKTIFSNESASIACDGGAETRNNFFVGLARLVDDIADNAQCATALQKLLAPPLHLLETLIRKNGDESTRVNVCDSLTLIADVIESLRKHKCVESSDRVPALNFVERVWEMLKACGSVWPTDIAIANAICSVYNSFFQVCGKSLAGMFCPAIEQITNCFKNSFSDECLKILAQSVIVFISDPATVSLLFSQVLSETVSVLQHAGKNGPNGSQFHFELWKNPDVIAEFLHFCRNLIEYCPQAIFQNELLDVCLEITTLVLQNVQEPKALRSAFLLWKHFLTNPDRALSEALLKHAEKFVPRIVVTVMFGIAGGRKPGVESAYTNALYDLLLRFPDLTKKCVEEALKSPDFPSRYLTIDDKRLFMEGMCKQIKSQSRFRALIQDFGDLCNGKNTSDCLVNYQIEVKPRSKHKHVVIIE